MMATPIDPAEIAATLRDVGVRAGDLVMVHSRLFSIGLVHGVGVSEIPHVYLRAFREALGERGTLVVPTFTTSFGRYGTPFIYEDSPSEMGIFSETVRRTPGSRGSARVSPCGTPSRAGCTPGAGPGAVRRAPKAP